jgi:hypothetical protein
MIGFNVLGQLGQLGNQMFQVAALRGIASHKGYNFCFPITNDVYVDHLGNKLRVDIQNVFTLQNVSPLNIQFIDPGRPTVAEGTFHFNEKLFDECPDWVTLQGFFQSEKYFAHDKGMVREMFTFRPEIIEGARAMVNSLNKAPVALHIRRGDFLRNSGNHHNLELEWYARALDKIDLGGRQVAIFSDDPAWCKKQKLFEDDDKFLISEGNTHYTDLAMMSLCTGHIIANSTFSWWGAWLADSKEVIAPKKWFGPDNANLDTKDLYPDHWEVLE